MPRQLPRWMRKEAEREKRMKHRSYPQSLNGNNLFLDAEDAWTEVDGFNVASCAGTPCVDCGGHCYAHQGDLVVETHGACRGNGQRNPSPMAIGVHFGQGYGQISQLLPKSKYRKRTNQKAALLATIRALKEVLNMADPGDFPMGKIESTTVKTNSQYVVKGITEYIHNWHQNGFLNARGRHVVNQHYFRMLEALVVDLNQRDIVVLFWHVPLEYNSMAHSFANRALDLAGY